jgi:prepilin-type processing-associated H-X9-DG protein
MLIVMSLLVILISMLLPAVQQVRESARRLSCQNNQMQIASALLQYESAQEHLPPGVINDKGPIADDGTGLEISFYVLIMPYLEQPALAENFNFAEGAYAAINESLGSLKLGFLNCPSDNATLNNYAGCHHHQEAPIDVDNKGLLFLNSQVRHREIQDGRVHTILLGEKLSDTGESNWLSGTRATLRNTGSFSNKPWRNVNPAPVNLQSNQVATGEELIVGGFSSRHSGGCIFSFADGSQQFVEYSIDPAVLENLGHRADGAMMGRCW